MARSFNGGSDIIDLGNPAVLGITSSITVSVWAKPSSFPAGTDLSVMCAKGYDGSNEAYVLRFSGQDFLGGPTPTLQFFTFSGSITGAQWVYGANLLTGTWYNLVGSYDGSVWTIYAIGVSRGTLVSATGPQASTAKASIGAEFISGAAARFFSGNVADTAIWNTALSAAEVGALNTGVRPYTIRPASLVGYWPLDGLSSPEPDLSSHANNGTLTGTSLAAGPPTTLFTPKPPNLPTIPTVIAAQVIQSQDYIFSRSVRAVRY